MAQTHYISIVNSKGEATDDDTAANITVAGVTDANLSHFSEDYIAQAGVVDLDSDCKVTAQGTPDMTVNCAAGTAYILNSSWTQNSNSIKYYRDICTVGASGSELEISSNASGSTRYDKICLKVDTTVISGGTVDNTGSNVCSYVVVEGTAGSGVPATPSDHLCLATITVADGETEITSGEITDKRVRAYVVDWQPVNDSLSYSDATTYSNTNTTYSGEITVGTGAANRYHVGQKITFSQSTDGVKYGIITKVADTTITVFLGTDYDFDNETITSVMVSSAKSPQGFPMDPTKWKVELVDSSLQSQASPTQNTWYNIGSLDIDIPIGYWDMNYKVHLQSNDSSRDNVDDQVTLSTANNSESNTRVTSAVNSQIPASAGNYIYAVTHTIQDKIETTAADTFYLNGRTKVASVDGIYFNGGTTPTIITFQCNYL